MKYLQFKYIPDKDLYIVFHKLLELRDCRIYISKNLYLEFLHYLYEITGYKFIHTGILKFPKLNKIVFESNRVRDGIFYVGRN